MKSLETIFLSTNSDDKRFRGRFYGGYSPSTKLQFLPTLIDQ